MQKLTAWSYSRWADWTRCPMYFKAKYVDKAIREAPSPQMERGDRVHKQLAAWVDQETGDMPPEARKFTKLVHQLRSLRAQYADAVAIEQQWGFDASWEACEWFGKNTWLRTILDVCVLYPDAICDVVDYKTGRKYDDNADQMELFGLAVLSRYPSVDAVTTRLWYLDEGKESLATFHRAQVPTLRLKWDERARQIFADDAFIAKPNDKCKWCPLRRSAGGTCKFG